MQFLLKAIIVCSNDK